MDKDTDTASPAQPRPASAITNADDVLVVPVIEEELRIGKRVVETGRVRVVKTVSESEHVWEEALRRDEVTVERVPVGRAIDGPVAVRYEGDTMIIPLVEEVIVVEKRLVLQEELHITRRSTEVREPHAVTLRREEAHVERVPAETVGAATGASLGETESAPARTIGR